MSVSLIEIKEDVNIFNMSFEDLLFNASHDNILKGSGKKKIYVIPNKCGITKKEDFLSWENPKINRYNKIIRMHEAGKWENVPLPQKPPVTGKEIYIYIDYLEKNYNVVFVFVRAVKR